MKLTRRGFLGMAGGASAAAALGLVPKRAQAHENLPRGVKDAITHRNYDAIKVWTNWLQRNNVKGFYAELGWPNSAEGPRLYADGTSDIPQWQALSDKAYRWLDDAGVWVTAWTAGITQSPSIWKMYVPTNPEAPLADKVLGVAYGQAAIVESHPTTASYKRGVNASGGELHLGMSDEQFSNQNSGVYGQHYVYPSRESLAYLAGRGHKLVRVPFRWERVQPSLGGNLRRTEVERLKRCVTDARAEGMVVILDLHNHGRYFFTGGAKFLGESGLPTSAFKDVWKRLSRNFKDVPGVAGYQLMNEPQQMPGGPEQWERASRGAVEEIRANGDKQRLMVSGYHKSYNPNQVALFAFVANHPSAWIRDPANKIFYTTHGYWGHYGYDWTYDESNAYFERNGYRIPA